MIVFLDFDGVLHPRSAAGKLFVHLPRVEAVLRDFPDVEVVVSSTWRESQAVEELRNIFSADMRHRVIATTPVLEIEYPPGPVGIREKEIRAFLLQENYTGRPWVAVDDEAPLFTVGCPYLILCDSLIGLNDEVEEQLRERLLNYGMGPGV